MIIKKLSTLCFAAVVLASTANAQIAKRVVTTPASSTSPGGVAVVAIPSQSDVCTVSNGKCGSASVGTGGSSSPRPWTSYFLGQSKSYGGVSLGPGLPTTADTIIKIDGAGVAYFSTNSLSAQGKWMSAGQPTSNETLVNSTWQYCGIFPTWSNNSNKLAGFAPDGWSQSGQTNGTEVGCGHIANTVLNPTFSPD